MNNNRRNNNRRNNRMIYLPKPIIGLIFAKLTTREILQSRLICKDMDALIKKAMPYFNIKYNGQKISQTQINIIKSAKINIDARGQCYNIDNNNIINLINNCQNIDKISLTIRDLDKTKTKILSTIVKNKLKISDLNVTLDYYTEKISNKLSIISTNLKKIDLSFVDEPRELDLLIECLTEKNSKELDLKFSACNLDKIIFDKLANKKHGHIKSLNLTNNWFDNNNTSIDEICHLMSNQPNGYIQNITIHRNDDLTDQALYYISQQKEPIKSISLENCEKITDIGLQYLIKTNIQKLTLAHCSITPHGLYSFYEKTGRQVDVHCYYKVGHCETCEAYVQKLINYPHNNKLYFTVGANGQYSNINEIIKCFNNQDTRRAKANRRYN